jgi:prepilin-type N-terminal cleavage/methylation domain-containing protein
MSRVALYESRLRSSRFEGFSLVELLVVMTVIGLLAALLFPALSAARENSRRIRCGQNLRQINLALALYALDNHDVLPPPQEPVGYWPSMLWPQYVNLGLLLCPTDQAAILSNSNAPCTNADGAPRCYLINDFVDYYATQYGVAPGWNSNIWSLHMRQSCIAHPSATIAFAEKADSSSAYGVNIFQSPTGSYLTNVAENRHGNLFGARTKGASNFAMTDGSVQLVPYGEATCPLNLWAVLDQWRIAAALCRPHLR